MSQSPRVRADTKLPRPPLKPCRMDSMERELGKIQHLLEDGRAGATSATLALPAGHNEVRAEHPGVEMCKWIREAAGGYPKERPGQDHDHHPEGSLQQAHATQGGNSTNIPWETTRGKQMV